MLGLAGLRAGLGAKHLRNPKSKNASGTRARCWFCDGYGATGETRS